MRYSTLDEAITLKKKIEDINESIGLVDEALQRMDKSRPGTEAEYRLATQPYIHVGTFVLTVPRGRVRPFLLGFKTDLNEQLVAAQQRFDDL